MLFKLRFLVLLSVAFSMTSCAGSSKYMRPAQVLLTPTEGKALVRFMRPYNFLGAARDYGVLDREKVIGSIPVDCQFDYLTDPGKHLFWGGFGGSKKVFLEANLEAEKTYYVILVPAFSMLVPKIKFLPVKKDSEYWDKVLDYEKEFKKLEPDPERLKEWSKRFRQSIAEDVSYYEAVLKHRYQDFTLSPEDGR